MISVSAIFKLSNNKRKQQWTHFSLALLVWQLDTNQAAILVLLAA